MSTDAREAWASTGRSIVPTLTSGVLAMTLAGVSWAVAAPAFAVGDPEREAVLVDHILDPEAIPVTVLVDRAGALPSVMGAWYVQLVRSRYHATRTLGALGVDENVDVLMSTSENEMPFDDDADDIAGSMKSGALAQLHLAGALRQWIQPR